MLFEKWRKKKSDAAHDQTNAAAGADPRPAEGSAGQGYTDMDDRQMRMVQFAQRTAGQPETSYVPGDHSLLADLHAADEWATGNLNKTGHKADHTLESMREVERFIDENPSLFAGKSGSIVFSLGGGTGSVPHVGPSALGGARAQRPRRLCPCLGSLPAQQAVCPVQGAEPS